MFGFNLVEETQKHRVYRFLFFKIKLKKIKNNKIYIIDGQKEILVKKIKGIKFEFLGENSVVKIHKPMAKFNNCLIKCGSNCKIEIEESKYRINLLRIFANADNSECFIGKNLYTFSTSSILLSREPNLKVEIGENCMFGTDVQIRTTDVHTITDLDGNVLNFGESVKIGNHVWLARQTVVMKGVTIADNSVLALGSICTKSCLTPNSIYAGTPAKLVKQNINWDKEIPTNYKKNVDDI